MRELVEQVEGQARMLLQSRGIALESTTRSTPSGRWTKTW
jgi:hypothetical protein